MLLLLCGFTHNLAALGRIMWPPAHDLACTSVRPGKPQGRGWKYNLAESLETEA
jgi:hypothetical protein